VLCALLIVLAAPRMDRSTTPNQPSGTLPCPACGTSNSIKATTCRRCGEVLPSVGGRTLPIGGRTTPIGSSGQSGGGARAHLVAPKDLDLGSLRAGETARGKLRIANNGGTLLTGTARIGPGAPWLRVLGSGTIYCAAGAVEAIDVQVDTGMLGPGRQVGTVQLATDGGQATVEVIVTVFRDSMMPAIIAGLVTAVTFLAIAGLVFAGSGGKVPFLASATSTPSPLPTRPPATATPTMQPTATLTAGPTATVVHTGATATAW
jgi:hypothetical protein